ncbi:acyl-CoA N-acyltransferase [Pelagophyceae sp. CCMP2097]|nr:acyl-CoA N-acyltransferase [Pelagophyceae sp. CCMP2097]
MPDGFAWSQLDVTDKSVLAEIYTLLNENYVEDDDAMFRFDYSMPFLEWALTPPNYDPSFHLGVRNEKAGSKLMAFITGVPAVMTVRGKAVRSVEINYLCVHKKLRTKRLAPVLIKEITRRVNLEGIFQAVYTAGVVLPRPVASCRYYHRSLDPKKLIEIGFSRLMPRMTMARTIKLYKVADEPLIPGLRAMTPADVPSAHALLQRYLTKFSLAPDLSEPEFAHWLLPRKGVVDSFVVCDAAGVVTDMCSFYHLPSTVIGHEKHETLFAAYSFYNVATTVPLLELMRDALTCARRVGMDVFNALNIMENDVFFKDLKFGIGDGHLQYYVYNWRCADMQPADIGLVLL